MLTVSYLFEQRVNAPQFIYKILYNDDPPFMRGRTDEHSKVYYNDIPIDSDIPLDAVKKLNNIKGITITSSCEGSNEKKPTFVIFRSNNQNKDYVKKIVNNLNNYQDIKAGFDIGNAGMYRIGVTHPNGLYYSKDKKLFEKWWKELPKKIQESL